MSESKTCGCGLVHTPKQFTCLPIPKGGGTMEDGTGGFIQLRNCLCGSTIARPMPLAVPPAP